MAPKRSHQRQPSKESDPDALKNRTSVTKTEGRTIERWFGLRTFLSHGERYDSWRGCKPWHASWRRCNAAGRNASTAAAESGRSERRSHDESAVATGRYRQIEARCLSSGQNSPAGRDAGEESGGSGAVGDRHRAAHQGIWTLRSPVKRHRGHEYPGSGQRSGLHGQSGDAATTGRAESPSEACWRRPWRCRRAPTGRLIWQCDDSDSPLRMD
mgnify:CR=1 FL=1